MTHEWYQYRFEPHVPLEEVQACLVLSFFALESLHGEAQVLLDACYAMEESRHACLIDASTRLGKQLNRLFVGFLKRELKDGDFHIERVRPPETISAAAAI